VKASHSIFALCAALFALAGCSTPCESVCSTFNDCAIDQRSYEFDCGTYCGRVEQFQASAEAAGADTCKTQFDAYISCWETNIADICNAENTQCDASAAAWVECMAKFCAVEANAKDPGCVVQDEGPALPALGGF
jgi:hypothetical protein